MKIQALLLIIFSLTNIKCIPQKKEENNKKLSTINQKMRKVEKIELKEQTRGTNRLISFTPDSVITVFDGEKSASEISVSDWENIVKQANLIDLSKISTYESPTTKRFSDGALSSTIIITSEGKTYESSTFDAGIPPKELEGLYLLLRGKSGTIKRSTPKLH